MRNTNQTNSPPRLLALLFGAALLGLVSQSALALGTLSGTPINNQATLNYTVGTTAQTAINASVGFVVDNKVNLTVANVADNASTIPNLNNQAVAFTVTNNGNTPQRYALSAVVGASTLTTPLTNVRIYRDNGSAPGVWDATDTLYGDAGTFLDVAPDASLNVLIVADVPASDTNGETVVYSLLATTVGALSTGSLLPTAATAGPNTAGVDVVFADPMSGIAGDSGVARDGQHAASATYTIATAALTVSKTATVYSDPFTGVSANAKAIPGAVITYTITVANAAGGATATSVSIADSLNAEITSLPPHLAFATQFTDGTNACAAGQGVVVAGGGEIAGGVCKTNAVGGDVLTNADFTANQVNVSGLSIAGGTTATIKFQVVVQ